MNYAKHCGHNDPTTNGTKKCATSSWLRRLPERTLYIYLQMWNELSGTNELVAFDEGGEVRTFPQLYGTSSLFSSTRNGAGRLLRNWAISASRDNWAAVGNTYSLCIHNAREYLNPCQWSEAPTLTVRARESGPAVFRARLRRRRRFATAGRKRCRSESRTEYLGMFIETGSLAETLEEIERRGWKTTTGSDSWTVCPTAPGRADCLRYSQLAPGIDTLLHSER